MGCKAQLGDMLPRCEDTGQVPSWGHSMYTALMGWHRMAHAYWSRSNELLSRTRVICQRAHLLSLDLLVLVTRSGKEFQADHALFQGLLRHVLACTRPVAFAESQCLHDEANMRPSAWHLPFSYQFANLQPGWNQS